MSKPLKSIKFPNNEEIYTITQLDTTLKESGKSADSKIVGDKFITERNQNNQDFANALTRTVQGEVIALDDVSPLEHEVGCKVERKNLLSSFSALGVATPLDNPIYVKNGDRLTLSFKESTATLWRPAFKATMLDDGKIPEETKTFDGCTVNVNNDVIYNAANISENHITLSYIGDVPIKINAVCFYQGNTTSGTTFSEAQLEFGSTPSPYTPYVPDLSAVTVTQTPGGQVIQADVEGDVKGFKSKYPHMEFTTDNPGALLEVTYNRDNRASIAMPNHDGVLDYGLPGQVAFSDGTGGIYWGNSKESETFTNVANAVRAGLAPQMYPVGYEFTTRDESNNRDITWVVRGHNNFKKVDDETAPTMTLEMKNVWSNSGGTQIGVQFCSAEALIYSEAGLEAGTYNFTVAEQAWFTGDNGKTFQFTLSKPLPAKGQIVLAITYNQTMEGKSVKTYASSTSTEAIETATLTEGATGTALGTTDGKSAGVNHMHRAIFGSNNYAQSAYRQFLNSSADAGSVWEPKTVFNRPPSWATSQAGLLKGLPKEFIDAVATVTIPCRTNDVMEVNSLDGTVFEKHKAYNVQDKFFVLSMPEIYGKYDQSDVKDGEVLEYYDGLADAQRIKRDAAGTARDVWLRSPYPWLGSYVRRVYPDGSYYNRAANGSHGVAAACVIA